MKKVSFDIYRKNTSPYISKSSQSYDTVKNNKKTQEQDVLKGVLLNTCIKDSPNEDYDNFSDISTRLLIPSNTSLINLQKTDDIKDSFDFKKAMKPIAIFTGFALSSIAAISIFMKKYSNIMLNKAGVVNPGDLARNINIVEEPHFAMYRALRDPNAKNVLGLIGVGIMTGVTICAKNFVDGAREIWIKKQNCNIEHDLQKNLISVETEAFSGKLDVVNTLLADSTNYFKSVLKNGGNNNTNFKSFLSFKGEDKNNTKKEDKNNRKKILLLLGGIAGITGLSFMLFKNYQKTVSNLDGFYHKFEDKKIRIEMDNATKITDKQNAIQTLVNILKTINAKDETMKSQLSKINGITEDEIAQAVNEVKKAQIYAQAPEALGGISEKIQYYCYINEERGHLYNWILNPENKFNKYIFLSFSFISSLGYLARSTADAIKNVTVGKENSKSELNLRRQLVQVEIDNFKAKKLSAINPMLENFKQQAQQGKSKQELKELAENILMEIKNGPPYVYA